MKTGVRRGIQRPLATLNYTTFADMINRDDILTYNTSREPLVMKEYGRHVQQMVQYLLTIQDPQKRQRNAETLIELMGFLNPQLKNVEDFRHKLWDHLHFMSDFKLEVESPYPVPTYEDLKRKPEPLKYPKRYPRYSHLGKNIEIVINNALAETDPGKKQEFANAIAYYMKLTYSNWHKELVHDDNIQNELSTITNGELEFNNRPFVKHRADNRPMDDYPTTGRNQFRKNFNGRNNNNNNNNRNSNNNNRQGGNGNRNNRNFKKRY